MRFWVTWLVEGVLGFYFLFGFYSPPPDRTPTQAVYHALGFVLLGIAGLAGNLGSGVKREK